MALPKISVKHIYKIFPNNKMMDNIPLIKVSLIVEVNFETFGQVWFTDENGRSWIKEFRGRKWEREILMKDNRNVGFSVFINNQYQQKERVLTLTKMKDDDIVDQKVFNIDGEKLFDGWFKF